MRIAPVITASCLLCGVAGPAGAQHPDIDREVERLVPQITEIRHRIHEHPELGNREVETAALVADHLRQLVEMARRKGTFWQREKGPLCRVVVATWPDGAERREATSRRVPINAFSSVERGPSGSVGRP